MTLFITISSMQACPAGGMEVNSSQGVRNLSPGRLSPTCWSVGAGVPLLLRLRQRLPGNIQLRDHGSAARDGRKLPGPRCRLGDWGCHGVNVANMANLGKKGGDSRPAFGHSVFCSLERAQCDRRLDAVRVFPVYLTLLLLSPATPIVGIWLLWRARRCSAA
jgi:hypothetical protein